MFKEDIKRKLNLLSEIGFSMCMIDRRHLIVSGVKRINTLNTQFIKLKIGAETVEICGKSLEINQIGGGDVLVYGVISEVKFEQ